MSMRAFIPWHAAGQSTYGRCVLGGGNNKRGQRLEIGVGAGSAARNQLAGGMRRLQNGRAMRGSPSALHRAYCQRIQRHPEPGVCTHAGRQRESALGAKRAGRAQSSARRARGPYRREGPVARARPGQSSGEALAALAAAAWDHKQGA